jgi:D-alanine-D-alanine ligase
VVKPAAGGSSLGVRFAAAADEVPEALVAAFSYDDRVLLERHVAGRELAVSLLSGIALPAVEVRPREEDRFSYEARYEIGRTEYICPADLGVAEGPVLDAALRAWDALGFDGFGRIDMILGDDGPQVLEANAIPGLTDTSLLPMAAEGAGLSFEQLCERIVELALSRPAAAAQPSG